VFRVEPRLEPGAGTLASLSSSWTLALAQVDAALAAGRVPVAIGEPGSGRSTLLAQALRRRYPRHRILAAAPPAAQDMEAWLGLWTPELGKPHTAVLVRDADLLPLWVAERLRDLVVAVRRFRPQQDDVPFAVTAAGFDALPGPLGGLVDTVVAVPPLRERGEDVVPLVLHAAQRARGREIGITAAAETALRGYGWPGNVRELQQVVRQAATRTDVIDVRHLPPDVLAGSTHRLTRIEAFERDEIVRVLSRPGVSMREAAEELGMSRATVYRKLAQYDIHLPRGT
jgi:sigma-54 dependent transcriptional regulator, acetoin dehydrogenase operon transcriptional activator AcoR